MNSSNLCRQQMPRRKITRRTTTRRKPAPKRRTTKPRTITLRIAIRAPRKRRTTERQLRKINDYKSMSSGRMSIELKKSRAYENYRAARYRGDKAREQKYLNEYAKYDRQQIALLQREIQ